MKKLFSVVLFVIVPLLLAACGGSNPSAKIKSVEYVDSIPASGGVSYSFEGSSIIKIILDVTFDKEIASDLDPSNDNYRGEIYAILVEGTHFYFDGQELGREYGYWPEDAGSDYAKEISLFYVVPTEHSISDLRFVYDGSVLGDGGSGIDTNLNPK